MTAMGRMKEHTIDAAGKRMGRVAAEAAAVLMGKNSVSFARNRIPDISVVVRGAGKLAVAERKRAGKIYRRYSGYPGGLLEETLGSLIARRGAAEALRRAVSGMLPKNKLRARMLRRLTIVE